MDPMLVYSDASPIFLVGLTLRKLYMGHQPKNWPGTIFTLLLITPHLQLYLCPEQAMWIKWFLDVCPWNSGDIHQLTSYKTISAGLLLQALPALSMTCTVHWCDWSTVDWCEVSICPSTSWTFLMPLNTHCVQYILDLKPPFSCT